MIHYLRATETTQLGFLEEGSYKGLAFGAEFCPRRLPTPDEVIRARAFAAQYGAAFTLVTPLVRESQFDEVAAWLKTCLRPTDEWVANDWGLLTWARENGVDNPVSAGRLLGRQRRGPRVVAMAEVAGEAETSALQGSLWDDPAMVALLVELGVTRVELDALPQGVRRPELPEGMGISICGPYIAVTLTPACPLTKDPLTCTKQCRFTGPVIQTNEENETPLYTQGNATFARVEENEAVGQGYAVGADRMVWAEEIPG